MKLTEAQRRALEEGVTAEGFYPCNGSQRSMAYRLMRADLLEPPGGSCRPYRTTLAGRELLKAAWKDYTDEMDRLAHKRMPI